MIIIIIIIYDYHGYINVTNLSIFCDYYDDIMIYNYHGYINVTNLSHALLCYIIYVLYVMSWLFQCKTYFYQHFTMMISVQITYFWPCKLIYIMFKYCVQMLL